MLDSTYPSGIDAKSAAFYQLTDVTQLRLANSRASTTVSFASASSPVNLMTTNNVPFSPYPDYTAWRNVFSQVLQLMLSFVPVDTCCD